MRAWVLFAGLVLMTGSVHSDNARPADQFDPTDADFLELASRCLGCHASDSGTTQPVGPTLTGVVGRRVADLDDYGYSTALYRFAALGRRWDEPTLNQFLESPQAFAPGVAMKYAGVSDPERRAELVAWLASGPVTLPVDVLKPSPSRYSTEVDEILQLTANVEYGEFLAGQCQGCHFAPGVSGGVPPISGLPADYFVHALLAYQQGARSNSVMQTMSLSLGKAELAALASFYSVAAE